VEGAAVGERSDARGGDSSEEGGEREYVGPQPVAAHEWEKNASRAPHVAPDAAAARRRRLARVGDAGEWGTERRKSDSAWGRSSGAAARERSFASSSIQGVSLFVRSEESIPRRS